MIGTVMLVLALLFGAAQLGLEAAPQQLDGQTQLEGSGQQIPEDELPFSGQPAAPSGEQEVFCTMEVRECSDGSFVGRNPANGCAFDPCPAAQEGEPEGKFCTMDAKICEDGSAVGRDPANNCEFRECPPPVVREKFCTMEAMMCPDGSSVGRNPQNNCAFDPCPQG